MKGQTEMNNTVTHEAYINGVVEAAKAMVARSITNPDGSTNDEAVNKLRKLNEIKVVYGMGGVPGALGVTYYSKWTPSLGTWCGKQIQGPVKPTAIVEVCAAGQKDWTEVAHTVVHELGHVIAGYGHGHDKVFKDVCKELGLRIAKAVAGNYSRSLSNFDPKLRRAITSLPLPTDGTPIQIANRLGVVPTDKPCGAGVGTRGGKSRGTGSGSRLLKCCCNGCGYTVRVTKTWFDQAPPLCNNGHEITAMELC